MHAMMELLDVERLKTTIFHPECDGQSERDIQTFKKMITAYINEEQSNWDQHIEVLAYAFNSSVHASTGYTPFEAMTGRQPKLPIDLLYPTVNVDIQDGTSESQVEKLPETQPTMKEKLHKSIGKLKGILKRTGDHIGKSKLIYMERAKLVHDRRIKPDRYEKDDLVLCSHPKIAKGQSKGLAPKYYGPFKIVKCNSNACTYVIQRLNKPKSRLKQVHKNNLKRYFSRGLSSDEENITPTQPTPKPRRQYNKKMDLPRWRIGPQFG